MRSAGRRARTGRRKRLSFVPSLVVRRKNKCSVFVENPLRNLTLAQFAPFPPLRSNLLVQVLVCDSHAAEPNLGFAFANLLQLWATSEVEKVG